MTPWVAMTTKLHEKRQGQECGAVQEASVVLRCNAVSGGKTPPIPMPTCMQASGMLAVLWVPTEETCHSLPRRGLKSSRAGVCQSMQGFYKPQTPTSLNQNSPAFYRKGRPN